MSGSRDSWLSLPLEGWKDTYATLHMWTQIVGKIRLAHAPLINHWWQVPLYVTSRGLTTSSIPYGQRAFDIELDFIDHELRVNSSDGRRSVLPLRPRSVAEFYRELMASLSELALETRIWTVPVEVETRIPFERDGGHASYDPESAQRFWRILVQVQRVLTVFRARFIGKCSPVHFFWGAFDLAVTRFSGRRAPEHPGAPNVARYVMREAYSHEVSSCGFWPGGGAVEGPAFYAYAYPEPDGFGTYRVSPREAFYSAELREYILPFDAVRRSRDPDATLLEFLQSTYEAAADLGGWDRRSLERRDGEALEAAT